MVDVMNIGRGGLLAYRTALAVTGDNIANVDTPNYTRRTAMLQETTPGSGVDVVEIRRDYVALLFELLRIPAPAEDPFAGLRFGHSPF